MEIPKIGFGTWKLAEGKEARTAVAAAIDAGYRLIDTAKLYGNETSVGEAIHDSGVPREELFVTTKLWRSDFGFDNTMVAFDESLDRLGLEYVDLYLIHWPGDDVHIRHESWRALIEIHGLGTAKNIGVSNFDVEQLKLLIDEFGVMPYANQIEFHPFVYENQVPILDYCREQGIVVEAYSPLAHSRDLENKLLTEIAKKHGKSPAQVMLRWCIEQGLIVLPKSVTPSRIAENIDIFDFALDEEDKQRLTGLNRDLRTCWDPTHTP